MRRAASTERTRTVTPAEAELLVGELSPVQGADRDRDVVESGRGAAPRHRLAAAERRKEECRENRKAGPEMPERPYS